uniref:Lipoprotein n=1 Tax=Prevotella sp. GTC17262 TaxID=3236797 RepID=A0AB33JPX7_9BACT
MKNKYISIAFCLACMLLSSCIKEDWGVIPETDNITETDKGWNKNKTIDVYFVTDLKDEMANNIPAIADYLNTTKEFSIAVVDRTDVEYFKWADFARNYSTELMLAVNRFSTFAFNRFGDMNIEGSTILFNHKINSAESYKVTDDCYIQLVPILAKSNVETPVNIEVPFATTRFSSEAQISAATDAFKTLSDNTHQAVIVGTVKTSAVEKLKAVAGSISGYAYTPVVKDESNDYSLFMIAPKSWVLRETEMKSTGGSNAYHLSIEASVE